MITAIIEETNRITTYPDTNGGETYSADVLVSIIDSATGEPANGDNCVVTYQINANGDLSTNTVTVPGQSVKIYSGKLRESRYSDSGEEVFSSYKSFSILSSTLPTGTPPPATGFCDLKINYIRVDQPESAAGAADAQITVNASTTYGPVQYSIDLGITWQVSATFAGLSAGLVQVMVKDSNTLGCADQSSVSIPSTINLLTGDPSVTLQDGNISRWNAAFNPIVFTYQRKDFEVLNVTADTETGNAKIAVNASFTDNQTGKYLVNAVDKVYINAGAYNGVYNVLSVPDVNHIIINTTYSSDAAGFININSLRPYYQVLTRITYQDKLTGSQSSIVSTNRPDNTGLVKADLSNFLQSILRPKDENDYAAINYRDDNLSASYTIAYAEHHDNGTDTGYTSAYRTVTEPFYVVYAAKQLGDAYGGNLAAYVPFKTVTDASQRACWLTDFAEPAYSIGYPFDLGFIYSEDLIGLQLYCALTLLDINRNPLAGGTQASSLINEDSSWLLNQDGSKFTIADQTLANTDVPAQLGLNRLSINGSFPREAFYLNIALKYDDEHGTHIVTQTQTVRIDDAVDDNSVYLRWIGLSGSWNYYRFVFNQELSLDVQNAVIIKNFVNNWQDQDGIEEVISKSAGQKMKVMAEDLSVTDIKGLQSIKYSPKVQMLVNKNTVKWQTIVINTATYSEYETRNGRAPFSVTFNTPSINIQTQ